MFVAVLLRSASCWTVADLVPTGVVQSGMYCNATLPQQSSALPHCLSPGRKIKCRQFRAPDTCHGAHGRLNVSLHQNSDAIPFKSTFQFHDTWFLFIPSSNNRWVYKHGLHSVGLAVWSGAVLMHVVLAVAFARHVVPAVMDKQWESVTVWCNLRLPRLQLVS